MRLPTPLWQLLLQLGLLVGTSMAVKPSGNPKGDNEPRKVLLSNIRTLTFERGSYYMGRRSEGAQLKCLGGNAAGFYQPHTVQCTNMGPGYDVSDVQWACTAAMPKYYKLGRTDVVCEGFSDPDDPFVTRGSCSLEYTLHLTELGEKAYSYSKFKPRGFWPGGELSYADIAARVAIVGVALVILVGFLRRVSGVERVSSAARRARRFFVGGPSVSHYGGGGGGGGGGGHGWGGGFGAGGPPPAYDDDPRGYNKPSGLSGVSPWAAGMVGAAAGYGISRMMGNNNNNNGEGSSRGQSRSPPMTMREMNTAASMTQGPVDRPRSSNLTHGPPIRHDAPHLGQSNVPMHTSTGFGTTKRR